VLARRVQSRPPPNSDQKISNNELSHPSPLPPPYKASQPRRQYNCLVILTPRVTHKILFQRVQFTVFFSVSEGFVHRIPLWTSVRRPPPTLDPLYTSTIQRRPCPQVWTRPSCRRLHVGRGILARPAGEYMVAWE